MTEKPEEENKRSILAFACASFLNDFGSDMIYPVWPLFVTSVMGANMAVPGLIDGLDEAFVSISKAISGYLSDRIRKRKFFIVFPGRRPGCISNGHRHLRPAGFIGCRLSPE